MTPSPDMKARLLEAHEKAVDAAGPFAQSGPERPGFIKALNDALDAHDAFLALLNEVFPIRTRAMSRPAKKPVVCRYCEQGNVVRNGEHWIVKSIIPARITIVECKAAKATEEDTPND